MEAKCQLMDSKRMAFLAVLLFAVFPPPPPPLTIILCLAWKHRPISPSHLLPLAMTSSPSRPVRCVEDFSPHAHSFSCRLRPFPHIPKRGVAVGMQACMPIPSDGMTPPTMLGQSRITIGWKARGMLPSVLGDPDEFQSVEARPFPVPCRQSVHGCGVRCVGDPEAGSVFLVFGVDGLFQHVLSAACRTAGATFASDGGKFTSVAAEVAVQGRCQGHVYCVWGFQYISTIACMASTPIGPAVSWRAV